MIALVLGGVAAGLVLSLDAASAHGRPRATARFPGFQLSFRYPSTWERRDWCWETMSRSPVTLLTTADPAPPCEANTDFGYGTPLPPPQRLGRDGVTAWWLSTDGRALVGVRPNEDVGGRPARVTVRREPHSVVTCEAGAPRRLLSAQIRGPSSTVPQIRVGAVVCGPDLASGEADVRQMLASVHFTR